MKEINNNEKKSGVIYNGRKERGGDGVGWWWSAPGSPVTAQLSGVNNNGTEERSQQSWNKIRGQNDYVHVYTRLGVGVRCKKGYLCTCLFNAYSTTETNEYFAYARFTVLHIAH